MLDPFECDDLQNPNIFIEDTWIYGAYVSCILYGITIVLYAMCFHSLWCRIRSPTNGTRKRQWFFFIYVNVVFALNTLYIFFDTQVVSFGFINYRNYPGGPSAYEAHTAPPPLNYCFIFANWCADSLMIWRCHIVYGDSRYHLFVTMLGCLMLFASMITGSLFTIIVSRPDPSSIQWMSSNLLLPYIGVSLSINVIVCTLTVLRLMYHRACISKAFGPEHGVLYTSIASMIIESAAVYAIGSLLYLISYATGSPLANAFCQILGEAQVIAPLLITYRISEGKAWEKDVSRRLAASNSIALRGVGTASSPANVLSLQQALDELDVPVPATRTQQCDAECGGSIPFSNEETGAVKGVAVDRTQTTPSGLELGGGWGPIVLL